MNRDDGTITKDNVSSQTYGYGYSSNRYDPKKCAAEATDTSSRLTRFFQCSRKPGFGTDCLFCKQHSKKDVSLALKAFKIKGNSRHYKNDYSIEEVDIEKFTDNFVFLFEGGSVRKEARANEYNIYIHSLEEAISYLKKRAEKNLKDAEESINEANKFLSSLKK
jgi:hypothetical protein